MKKLALFAFTLLSAWAMTAKTITGPVDYVIRGSIQNVA